MRSLLTSDLSEIMPLILYFITLFILLAGCTSEKQADTTEAIAVSDRSPYADKFIYQDIDNFLQAYSLLPSDGDSTAILQREYFDKGTPGLQEFCPQFALDAPYLAKSIREHPKYYASLIDLKARLITKEPEIAQMFDRLQEVYPQAPVPTIYYLIGGLRAGGNGGEGNYVLIGAEVYALKTDTDRDEFSKNSRLYDPSGIPHIVAHETTHILQEAVQGQEDYLSIYTNEEKGTLLAYAVREGGADYFAELISGDHINPRAHAYGDLHEQELWHLFKEEMHTTELGDWFFYTPKQQTEWPIDLGYYMGYKITEAYFQNAVSRTEAIEALLSSTDYDQFLEESGYRKKFRE